MGAAIPAFAPSAKHGPFRGPYWSLAGHSPCLGLKTRDDQELDSAGKLDRYEPPAASLFALIAVASRTEHLRVNLVNPENQQGVSMGGCEPCPDSLGKWEKIHESAPSAAPLSDKQWVQRRNVMRILRLGQSMIIRSRNSGWISASRVYSRDWNGLEWISESGSGTFLKRHRFSPNPSRRVVMWWRRTTAYWL